MHASGELTVIHHPARPNRRHLRSISPVEMTMMFCHMVDPSLDTDGVFSFRLDRRMEEWFGKVHDPADPHCRIRCHLTAADAEVFRRRVLPLVLGGGR